MTEGAGKPSEDRRAWAEVNLSALAHNAAELRSRLSNGCEMMAVVKSNAYGLGLEKVASVLRRENVGAFAVSTVEEGVRLRESGIAGEILILGCTHYSDAKYISDFGLSQLAADGNHAMELDSTGYKLRVHIAVDTGMHRLGVQPSDFDEIESIFKCENLTVAGIASHLASSDIIDDSEFTNLQIESFFRVVKALKAKGYDTGKTHIQTSYGIYNYNEVKCDYARAGIALYGVMSHDINTRIKPALRPALSLRARIAAVRQIKAGESVSYGRKFTAASPMRVATISIGYADGVPRQMSLGKCIIRGQKVPIIGQICMDMLMADVTGIKAAAPGDIATLIGKDGDEEIRCEDFAEVCGTISNDILCRLGERLPRIYVE